MYWYFNILLKLTGLFSGTFYRDTLVLVLLEKVPAFLYSDTNVPSYAYIDCIFFDVNSYLASEASE